MYKLLFILFASSLSAQVSNHRILTTPDYGWSRRVVPTAAYLDSTFNSMLNLNAHPATGTGSVVLSVKPTLSSTVTINGRLGVSTNTPTNFIDVFDATEPMIQITRSPTDFAIFGKDVNAAYLFSNNNTASLRFYTNNTLRAEISALGIVTFTGSIKALSTLSVSSTASIGGLVVQDGNQGTGKILVSDANGVASWTSPVSISSGTYTPTLFNTTNVSSSTAYVTGYYRIGNAVTVFGKVDIDATLAASSATELQMSLPVTSNMTSDEDLGGGATSDSIASLVARIKADAVTDRASLVFKSISITNDSYSFTLSYQIK